MCEAVTRPTMRFVPMKSAVQQAAALDHKARELLIRQQTQTVNALRAHLAEFAVVMAKGIHNLDRLLAAIEEAPQAARAAMDVLADPLRRTRARIALVTQRIEAAQAQRRPGVSARHRAWRGRAHRQRPRCDSACGRIMSFRTRLRRLAWPDAQTPFQRRQGSPAADVKGWRSVSAPFALSRRHGANRRPTG